VGEVVKLQKAPSGLMGLCPFHKESTPSFHVNTHRQVYRCFGCGKMGDVFSFVERFNGLNFRGAVEWLSGKPNGAIKLEGGESLRRMVMELQEMKEAVWLQKLSLMDEAPESYTEQRRGGVESGGETNGTTRRR
jgi:DNA primase